ncbi:PIN domain-containing protein [Nocardia sp. NPDC005978]|uniref:PIN domain-containing protein n=1 Tax=Nocardia sp. NPDC005978 TaxID=3156725 RepID=UPI0033A43207
MIGYLLDSSALWRILRDPKIHELWRDAAVDGDLRSCYPMRSEFLRSARNLKEHSQLCAMFDASYRDVAVPKSAELWIAGLQWRAAEHGNHQCLSVVDLQICATAAYHNLIVLHDDADYVTAARLATDLRQRNVHDGPPGADET